MAIGTITIKNIIRPIMKSPYKSLKRQSWGLDACLGIDSCIEDLLQVTPELLLDFAS